MLLVPVMAFGWVVSSAFIYWLIPAFNFVFAVVVYSDFRLRRYV